MKTIKLRPCQVPECRAQSPAAPRVGGKFMCIRHQAHLRHMKQQEREVKQTADAFTARRATS